VPPESGPALLSVAMGVEVLCFDGCPNREALLPPVRELLESHRAGAEIELVRVEDADAAVRERFLGSRTVRRGGGRGAGGGRPDFGVKCRLLATPTGRRRMPGDGWVLAAAGRVRAG
jgi:hypothetical protein